MQNEINKIQREIETIKTRNKRVEMDKAWETSWSRKILIALITYIIFLIFMVMAGFQQPFLEAIVPTAAYLLSMSTLPYFKEWWIKKQSK